MGQQCGGHDTKDQKCEQTIAAEELKDWGADQHQDHGGKGRNHGQSATAVGGRHRCEQSPADKTGKQDARERPAGDPVEAQLEVGRPVVGTEHISHERRGRNDRQTAGDGTGEPGRQKAPQICTTRPIESSAASAMASDKVG